MPLEQILSQNYTVSLVEAENLPNIGKVVNFTMLRSQLTGFRFRHRQFQRLEKFLGHLKKSLQRM